MLRLIASAGAPLQLGDLQPFVRLQTQPLIMNVQQVQSAAAAAATGDQWSAFLGSPDDRLPEVPPDGEFVCMRGSSVGSLLCVQSSSVGSFSSVTAGAYWQVKQL